MPKITFTIRAEELSALAERFKAYPSKFEAVVQPYLNREAPDTMEKAIRNRMPVSQVSKKSWWSKGSTSMRAGDHAKFGGSIRQWTNQLGFSLQTTSKYGYLIFPEEGRGNKQKRKGAQLFFQHGADESSETIVEHILKITEKILDE